MGRLSVCVEDSLKPLPSRIIATLRCGTVDNFVPEAEVIDHPEVEVESQSFPY